jgi:8-oxo-dGTP diphosphatase
VGAVITDDSGRLVVVRRLNPPSEGLWSLPGGRVEPGENLRAAVRREVWEETGLDVEVGTVAGTVTLPGPQDVRYEVTDFMCTPLSATSLVAGTDASDARWVTRDELADLPSSPGLVETLTRWGVWA